MRASSPSTTGKVRAGVELAVGEGEFENRGLRSAAHVDAVALGREREAEPAVGHRACGRFPSAVAVSSTLMEGGL